MQFQIELHSHIKTRTLVYFSSIQIVPSFQNDKLKERERGKKKKKNQPNSHITTTKCIFNDENFCH